MTTCSAYGQRALLSKFAQIVLVK
nr:unnamed protein product [Callosobruchus analis]